MNKTSLYAGLGFVLHLLWVPAARGAGADELSDAIAGGTASLSLRYRFENVDQQGIDDDARASTLRTRFTWTSAEIRRLTLGLEADYVSVIGSERYNSTVNGRTRYPVVADPDGFDLNQAYVGYTGEHVSATGGRQRILLGSQRFVGGVGWRQNEQTYDAVRIQASPVSGLAIDYAYVANVNRIFGPEDGAQPADWRSDSHLLTTQLELSDAVTIGAFGYLLDFDNDNGIPNSTATFGAEASATLGTATLTAAAATQSDYGDSPLDYRAEYLLLSAAVKLDPVSVTAGYELLGSDGGNAAFRTPLATLHKFQGWADKFLTTPDAGIRDLYAGASARFDRLTVAATYHDFDTDQGSADLGSEIDLAVTYSINSRASVQLKYADYDADTFATDTVKTWMTLMYTL